MSAPGRLKELREKLDSELEFDMRELRQELFDLRFKSSSEALANPHRIRDIKRDIARIRTLQTERSEGIRGAEPRN